MAQVDPKVYFANEVSLDERGKRNSRSGAVVAVPRNLRATWRTDEPGLQRTFLKWLHTSVTLGSVATGLLGISAALGQAAPTGFNGVRVVSLILLALSIAFCVQAIITYHKRAKLLDMRRSDGFDDNVAPIGMALSLVVALGAIYLVSLFKKSPVPH
jgi:uncharacterized membrane protein YidH (DUF202 family)